MTPVTHYCTIDGCRRNIPLDKLMCHLHWSMVPAALARDVWRTWKPHTLLPGEVQSQEYFEARKAAIAAVNAGIESYLKSYLKRHPAARP